MYMKPKSDVDPETGAMDPDSTEAHACTVAEVEVDTETGETVVLKMISASDVGKVINPEVIAGNAGGDHLRSDAAHLLRQTSPACPQLSLPGLNERKGKGQCCRPTDA